MLIFEEPKREKTILDCLASQQNCHQKLQMILYPLRLHLWCCTWSLMDWLFGLAFQHLSATLTAVSKIIILSTGPSTQGSTNLDEPEFIVYNVGDSLDSNDQDLGHVVELIDFKGESCHHKKQRDWKPTSLHWGRSQTFTGTIWKLRKKLLWTKMLFPVSGQTG